jgi:hypothetical protein
VLKAELGSDADKAPTPGTKVYVVYRGPRRGQSGREYHNYDIAKADADLEAVQATAKKKSTAKAAKADDADIPF